MKNAVSSTLNPADRRQVIPPSTAYDILTNERRRLIVEYLADQDIDEVPVGEIADHLATLGDDRGAAYVSLIQVHCPKLAQTGIVEYDARAKTVTPQESMYRLYDAHEAFLETLG